MPLPWRNCTTNRLQAHDCLTNCRSGFPATNVNYKLQWFAAAVATSRSYNNKMTITVRP